MNSFNDYQKFTGTVAIYPGAGQGTNDAISYTILGLNGEAGEVADKWKKVLRDDNAFLSLEARSNLIKELGDTLWYVARLADELGVKLSWVANMNKEKLSARLVSGNIVGSGDDR